MDYFFVSTIPFLGIILFIIPQVLIFKANVNIIKKIICSIISLILTLIFSYSVIFSLIAFDELRIAAYNLPIFNSITQLIGAGYVPKLSGLRLIGTIFTMYMPLIIILVEALLIRKLYTKEALSIYLKFLIIIVLGICLMFGIFLYVTRNTVNQPKAELFQTCLSAPFSKGCEACKLDGNDPICQSCEIEYMQVAERTNSFDQISAECRDNNLSSYFSKIF